MIINAVRLLILCIFAFIPLLLGEIAGRRSVNTTEDFILQGRKLRIFPMYATVFATWMSIFAFIGGITYFYEEGPIFMTTVGWDALFAVLFIIVGKRLWYYGRKYKYVTPVDFFDDIYGSGALNILVTLVTVAGTMVYLQVQIVGGLLVMRVATDGIISWYIGGIIFFSILVIYLWAGGLRAVAMTDIFYGILIVISILSVGLFLIDAAGGRDTVFTELIARDPANVSMAGEEGARRTMLWLSLFVIVPVGAFMGPQMWIRNYASGSEKNFNILPFLLCLSSVICVGTMLAGSAGAFMVEETDNPDYILMELLDKYADPFFYIFIVIGIYATIFSTANSQVHALSAVYTMDIYRRYINRNAPDKKLVQTAKWAVLIISLASYILIVLVPQNIFDLGTIALGGMAQLIVPVLGALFWNRSTSYAAIAGILAGEITFAIGLAFSSIGEASICAMAGLAANAGFFVLFALTDKPRIKIYKKIETYRRDYKVSDNRDQIN